jgi:DNA polymerase-3 subunit delta
MKKLTPEEFLKTVEQGKIEPLYLFTGLIPEGQKKFADDDRYAVEDYLLKQALRTLIEKALDPAARDFNLARLSALDSDLVDIVAAASELPAFSNRRLVVVRDLDKKMKVKSDDEAATKSDARLETLLEYLKHPVETTTLVFVFDQLDRRLNLVTALLKTCTIVEFKRLDDKEATVWVKNQLRRHGCFMEDSVVALVIGLVGTDLTLLSHELDKLVTYIGGRGQIGRADVESLVIHFREHSNFELTDMILARNRSRAWRLLKHQLDAGEEPVRILGAVASLYRRMLMSKELMAQGAPNAEVAKAAGMSPFAVGKFNEQVRRIQLDDILFGIRRIAEVDDAIKSSRGEPEEQLEILVCQLCS